MVPAAVLLANVYASSGDAEQASSLRATLNRSGAKKKAGLSWTAVDRKIYVSVARLLDTVDASVCRSAGVPSS